jgi:hypothetical protein
MKSHYQQNAEQAQALLGEGLCLAKWQQVSLHLPTGLNNSCYHPPLHEIDATAVELNPSALHNTEHKKQQRKIMLKHERPSECGYCWRVEDLGLGLLSDRHYRSGETWAMEHYDDIVGSTGDEDVVPSYVEVNFSNVCNLACSYCSPQFSSTWMEDVQRHGAFPTQVPHNDPNYFTGRRKPIPHREHNPYVEAFWKWWPDLYPQLKHFRMTGGEPMMDRNTYKVFDYVLSNPKPDLHLNVTSNFGVEKSIWRRYLDQVMRICESNSVEHFMQFVSLDCVGSRAEYLRDGLDFWLLWDRVNEFLERVPTRSSLTFIVTVNNLSLSTMHALMANILDLRKEHNTDRQRVWFDTPILTNPAWQSIQILPDYYEHYVQDAKRYMQNNLESPERLYKGFKDYEVSKLDRIIEIMRQKPDDIDRRSADFWRFFTEYDRRRKTNLRDTFLEMHQWFDHCQKLADESNT